MRMCAFANSSLITRRRFRRMSSSRQQTDSPSAPSEGKRRPSFLSLRSAEADARLTEWRNELGGKLPENSIIVFGVLEDHSSLDTTSLDLDVLQAFFRETAHRILQESGGATP